MYFQCLQRLPILTGLVILVLAKYAFPLDVPIITSHPEIIKYLKQYLPAIYPVLKSYVPPPSDRSSCPSPVPGARKLFYGVDITRFDFFPDDGFMQGFKSRVLAMTCAKDKKWGGFDLSDQLIHGVMPISAGSGSEKVSVFKSKSDVRNEMAATAELSGSSGLFSFSSSTAYKSMEHTIVNKDRFIQEVSSFEGSFKMTNSHPALDQHVQNYADTYLTGTYESNTAAYEKFIETYGTHYITTGHFGGLIKVVIETKTGVLSKITNEELEVNAKATYEGLIKSGSISFGRSKGKSTKNDAYNQASFTNIKYYGGSANLLVSEGFKKWQPTVDKDPWLVKADLKPIATLIKDKKKRKNLEEAVKMHMYRAYYKELARTKFELSKGGDIVSSKVMAHFGIHGKARADLEKEIKHHFITPWWFLGNKVCIGTEKRYYDKCTEQGGSIDKVTDPYKFIKGVGRKHVVFALKTSKPSSLPNWAKNITLCYRYREGDDTNCRGRGEQCADINSYTSLAYYIREYWFGRADCYISWKLSIPHNSPVWLQNNKLCLHYGPEGLDAEDKDDLKKKCNLATGFNDKIEMCALANEWTPYWRDGTNFKLKGKCWMQLLLKNVDGFRITEPASGP